MEVFIVIYLIFNIIIIIIIVEKVRLAQRRAISHT